MSNVMSVRNSGENSRNMRLHTIQENKNSDKKLFKVSESFDNGKGNIFLETSNTFSDSKMA